MKSTSAIWTVVLVGLIVVLCSILSLDGFPLPWQDEIHIVEMGRTVMDGTGGASAFAIDGSGTNFLPFYFIGPLLQECAYRLFGACGPRLAALAGLLVASILCGLWIRARGHEPQTAAFVSLLTMCNALLLQSVRLVRVDVWAFAILFLALALFWRMRNVARGRGSAVCGFLCGVDFFVWPSTVLFGPLVVSELITSVRREKRGVRAFCRDLGFLSIGGVFAGILCLLLSPNGIVDTLSRYYETTGGAPKPVLTAASVILGATIAWAKEALRDPLFILWVVAGIFLSLRGRRFLAILLAVIAFVLMIPSGLHTYRLLYLWPFLILFAAGAHEIAARRLPRATRLLARMTIGLMFAANVLSYVVAAVVNPRPSSDEVARRLEASVGAGPSNVVYSLSFQPYFAARSLGWTFRRFAKGNDVFDASRRPTAFKDVNVVLIPHEQTHYAVEESFTPFGLVRNAVIDAARTDSAAGRSSRLGDIGASLAFRSDSPERLRAFVRELEESGFSRTGAVSFAADRDRLPRWFRSLSGLFLATTGYDDLEVWKSNARAGSGSADNRRQASGR